MRQKQLWRISSQTCGQNVLFSDVGERTRRRWFDLRLEDQMTLLKITCACLWSTVTIRLSVEYSPMMRCWQSVGCRICVECENVRAWNKQVLEPEVLAGWTPSTMLASPWGVLVLASGCYAWKGCRRWPKSLDLRGERVPLVSDLSSPSPFFLDILWIPLCLSIALSLMFIQVCSDCRCKVVKSESFKGKWNQVINMPITSNTRCCDENQWYSFLQL